MVYRNDVEALEARYRVLEAELAEKRIARDEAASLLADARARAEHERAVIDLATHGPRRYGYGVILAVMMLAALVGVSAAYHHAAHRRDRMAKMLDDFSELTDRMCACRDAACVRRVTDDMASWAQAQARGDMSSKPDAALTQKAQEIAERLSSCMTAAMGNDAASDSAGHQP